MEKKETAIGSETETVVRKEENERDRERFNQYVCAQREAKREGR